jgi:hypothetical protein
MRADGFVVLSISIQKRKHGVKSSAYNNPNPTPKGQHHEKHTMDKADEEGTLLQGSF